MGPMIRERPSLTFRELCAEMFAQLECSTSSQIDLLELVEEECRSRRLRLVASVPRPVVTGSLKRRRDVVANPLKNIDIVRRVLPSLPLSWLVSSRRVCREWNQAVSGLRVSKSHSGVGDVLEGMFPPPPTPSRGCGHFSRLLGLIVLLRHGDDEVVECALKRLDKLTDGGLWTYPLALSAILGGGSLDDILTGEHAQEDEDEMSFSGGGGGDRQPDSSFRSYDLYRGIVAAGALPLLCDALAKGRDSALNCLEHVAAADSSCARRVAESVGEAGLLSIVAAKLAEPDLFASAARILSHCGPFLDADEVVATGAVRMVADRLDETTRQAADRNSAWRADRSAALRLVANWILRRATPCLLKACISAARPLVKAASASNETLECVLALARFDDDGSAALVEAGIVPRLCDVLAGYDNNHVRLNAHEKQRVAGLLQTVVCRAPASASRALASSYGDSPASLRQPLEPLVRLLQKTNARTKDIVTTLFFHVSNHEPRALYDSGAVPVLASLSAASAKVLTLAKQTLANLRNVADKSDTLFFPQSANSTVGSPDSTATNGLIKFLQINPKRPGTHAYARYQNYKIATTREIFLRLGGTPADYRADKRAGFLIEAPW